jgi:disulfide bond formation protein DsbB
METHPLYTEALNYYLALATLIGGAGMLIFTGFVTYFFFKKKSCITITLVSRYVLPLGFLLSLFGMVMSLFYSEVVKYAPCDLCWYQRIFMYSQVFIFGYAWYRKERNILPYTLMLSMIGFVIGVYNHMLQIGFDLMKPCSTAPFAVDCSKPSFIEYGFVTFPLMSVVLFGFLITFIFVGMKFKGRD